MLYGLSSDILYPLSDKIVNMPLKIGRFENDRPPENSRYDFSSLWFWISGQFENGSGKNDIQT